MKILLTNDDGIGAPGLRCLWESIQHAYAGRDCDIIVVAPDRCRSECGHGVTNDRPLIVEQPETDWYSISGTPVDCVRAALTALAPEVVAVFSGVNAGANLGVDLAVSGTFAAAREAAISGLPAMAISHYRRPEIPKTWDHVPRWLAPTLREFSARFLDAPAASAADDRHLWNVNLPAVLPDETLPPLVRCPVDQSSMKRCANIDHTGLKFRADFHARPREPGTDVDRCFSGAMTISELGARVG